MDLLFARVASKADSAVAQNRRGLRMTLLRVFQQPARACFINISLMGRGFSRAVQSQ
jgi:hypothetical protein